ncbi:uncharacterized protein LOC117229943 isoform X1 [Megalopta genalis]|uniref:uncharacterized protein LOC117229943 isoform X1 n=1 Tax=Megalopta genalis TaxID=115081 RepID=UPI003FD40044
MESYNFDKFITQARQLDTGIESLENVWSNPEICIGKFTERSVETDVHIEALRNSMRTVKEGIKATSLEVDKHIENSCTEHVLEETRTKYESLKEQCDNIELIFEKYGYQYDKNRTDQKSANSIELSEQETSQEATETVEVEFTPNLSWKYKTTCKDQSTLASNISDTSHLSTTPVLENNSPSRIDYLSSPISFLSTPISFLSTPIRERPEEPIYSKHFYNSLKK